MAALADLSALVNRLTGGNSGAPEFILQHKTVRSAGATVTAPVNGKIQSLWTLDGSPSGGVAPGAVAAPTNATAGALKQTDPVGGRQKWLQAAFPTASQNGTLIVYDRILHISGLSGTVITAQTVGGTLTRYTTGAGVFAFIEIYTAVGGTATTITMSYTNQSGTAGRTSPATTFGGANFNEALRVIPLPLQSGDTGIQSVQSVTVLATTGTAGNFGVTLGREISRLPVGASGNGYGRTWAQGLPGMPEILIGACLSLNWASGTTTQPEVACGFQFLES